MNRTMKNKKGFTLMEMLIVVAIIAVLVAIAIPVYQGQVHKAKVAADWANLRAYYAELQLDYLTRGAYNRNVPLTHADTSAGQMQQNDIPMLEVSAVPFAPANAIPAVHEFGAHIVSHCSDGAVADVVEYLDKIY